MAQFPVRFVFHSGLSRPVFQNVRLSGSWDSQGVYSDQWTTMSTDALVDESGCAAFFATVSFDDSQQGRQFQWGVMADTPGLPNNWAVPTEIPDPNSASRFRTFTLTSATQQVDYWFVTGRRFGAQKFHTDGQTEPDIRFSVWAPNAQAADVVFAVFDPAKPANGYIADDGDGVDSAFALQPIGGGVWQINLPRFADFHQRPYMFRITNEQGQVTYKTDMYSRNQIGRGQTDPNGAHYAGTFLDLDGTVSCACVADPDRVTREFNDTGIVKQTLVTAEKFWSSEFNAGRLPPRNVEDLVIYELHVGSLNFASTDAGDFEDALAFVPKLVELGVNAVELLPVEEFDGNLQWGYGTSHFFCMQTSMGGGNQLKHFIRACHRHGIAVILDVCYNHFTTSHGERAEWGYDSDPNLAPQHNIYQWYEGQPGDYSGNLLGGYLNNDSSGFAPRYWEENVRQMFTSSAAMLLDEFHADGLRVDLTDAIHQDNQLNFNGNTIASANLFGIKLLRELAHTVKTVNPNAFLIAEDHTGWTAMTQSLDSGGIGFDAVWYADFYHHLAGDGTVGDDFARLIKIAGFGGNGSLRMDYFAGALTASQNGKIVYHESHDEAGNGENTERTMVTAVNAAPLTGDTRRYAEARCRFAYGMSALSAGTPMFLMGEEIGAAKYFRYDTFAQNKEDLVGKRTGDGRFLFHFYQDLNGLTAQHESLRSRDLAIFYTHNDNRIVAFQRSFGAEQMLVFGSLNDQPFENGYTVQTDPSLLPAGGYKEIFNSDASAYGGDNIGNAGGILPAANGALNLILPAHGFVVLQKVS